MYGHLNPLSDVGFPWLFARNAVVACRDAGFPKRYQRGSLVVV